MGETHVYNHLRRNHGLIGGGKNKAAPTQPAYELFSLELSPFNIRELLARAVRLEFYKYCSYWKHLGIHFSLSFERLYVTGHHTHSLLMKIQDGRIFQKQSLPAYFFKLIFEFAYFSEAKRYLPRRINPVFDEPSMANIFPTRTVEIRLFGFIDRRNSTKAET